MNFTGKTSLIIDTLAGNNTVTVDKPTPTGLTTINVSGGGGNDTLVVNANDQVVSSADVTSATVDIPDATPVPIGYSAFAQISIIDSKDALTETRSARSRRSRSAAQ